MVLRRLGMLSVIVAAVLIALVRQSVLSTKRTVLPEGRVLEVRHGDMVTRHTFEVTSAETGGEYIIFEAFHSRGEIGALPGKSASPPVHIHLTQEECFEVQQGSMGYILNGTEGLLTADSFAAGAEPVCLPAGVPHTFWNTANETDLQLRIKVTPAGTAEEFFRTLVGFDTDYEGMRNVNPLQMVVTFMHGGLALDGVPAPVLGLLKYAIVPFLENVLGFQPFYKEYTHM